jgi:putative addiction module component (TIGR02574 family)
MNTNFKNLPVNERIRLVEDLWDSIASDQDSLPLTQDQKVELETRLQAFELDKKPGRLAGDVIKDIRKKL